MKKIQRLSMGDYEKIFALSEYAFQYRLSPEELKRRKRDLEDHTVLAWMEGDEILAKTHIIPLEVFICGKKFKMGGIASVASWPEYRRKGYIKDLLYHSLLEMKEKGQLVSFLAPFSFAFYRKYGWEYTFQQKAYEIPIQHFLNDWEEEGYVRRIAWDSSLLQKIYTKYARKYTGMLHRSDKWWKYRTFKDNFEIVVAYDRDGQPEGYMLYDVMERIFSVTEIIYLNHSAYRTLLHFIRNHDSMVDTVKMTVPPNDSLDMLFSEPRFKQEIVPYFMGRIVDVYEFLKLYPFVNYGATFSIELSVTDDFFQENTATYTISFHNGNLKVSKNKNYTSKEAIHCSVQSLATLLLGFKRPKELYTIGMIEGQDADICKLEKIIPNQQPYLIDYF